MRRLIRTNFFPMTNTHFSFYKKHSNNLNLNYPNILTNQTDFCFPKLYLSALIRTKIECMNKQLLNDVNWPNEAIWKSLLNKVTNDFGYLRNHFRKEGQVYKMVKYKMIVTVDSSRKHKILLFFTMADRETVGRVMTQTSGRAF